jgi:hypothetical protein
LDASAGEQEEREVFTYSYQAAVVIGNPGVWNEPVTDSIIGTKALNELLVC